MDKGNVNTMTTLDTIAAAIIKEQALVIGPLAWSEAEKVGGLEVDIRKGDVTITAHDASTTIDHLVARYERLFGIASREVCKEAAAPLVKAMAKNEIPPSLLS